MVRSPKALCKHGLLTEEDAMRRVIDPHEMGRWLGRRRH